MQNNQYIMPPNWLQRLWNRLTGSAVPTLFPIAPTREGSGNVPGILVAGDFAVPRDTREDGTCVIGSVPDMAGYTSREAQAITSGRNVRMFGKTKP